MGDLDNGRALNAALMRCTEEEAKRLLNHELRYGKRKTFVLRIHSRLNRLRAAREREELCARLV